ncbi:MAG: arylsulfatase [candidate division KSB1 bacterium]|nr:arylsulfatase [candidate division KSB1 bacterium]
MRSRRQFLKQFAAGGLSAGLFSIFQCADSHKSKQPNILLIMADDMGFSDLGFMGSGIQTPNIDRLARNGLVYNQFYNTSRCCPTRASLLTGLYQHQTGMGWMTVADLGHPGYTGDLNEHCITIAQALQQSGYACYMTGKWHVTSDKTMKPKGPKHNWPLQRGFDRYYGHLSGGGGYYHPKNLIEGNEWLDVPEDFYLTTAVNEKSEQFLREHMETNKNQPFFFYAAYYAPHRPLHALEKDVAKYRGAFMKGWDRMRKEKLARLYELGIADESWPLSERDARIPAWESLSEKEKQIWDARMAVYAGQIDCMDQGVGKMLNVLKEYGELENTLVLFLSDNGGCHEPQGGELDYEQIDELGQEYPMQSYRIQWANVSNTPFRMYKHWVHEGGIATPLILHWPQRFEANGEIIPQIGHVIDIMPTLLEITNTPYPREWNGVPIHPLPGKSLVANFDSEVFERGPIFFEHTANRAVRDGNWKLVSKKVHEPPYVGEWELYNLSRDRSETENLADQYPEKVENLAALWDQWAKEHDVYPIDGRGWHEKIKNPG